MKAAVVEIADGELLGDVHLFLAPKLAENHAVVCALENTSSTEEEIREHLEQWDCHAEGDYAVYVANVVDAR